MKKYLLILIISIMHFGSSFSQNKNVENGAIVYKVTPKMTNNRIYEKTSDTAVISQYIREYESKLTKYFRLVFNKDKSYYEASKTNNNGEQNIIAHDGSINADVKYTGSTQNERYTDLNQSLSYLYRDGYEIKYSLDTLKTKWDFLEDEKEILGYTCKKASITREVKKIKTIYGKETKPTKEKRTTTIWYTKEIPVAHGPAKYSGFPGVVLEVENNKIRISAESVNLNIEDFPEIEKPDSEKAIDSKEYFEIIKQKYGLKN